jgi:hypothetical protein
MTASGPHGRIALHTPREQFLAQLFDALWERYRSRVSYVQTYEAVVAAAGGRFVNDHIAFRTLAVQQPLLGIASISRIFEALGYRAAGSYQFPDKQLAAHHFQHPHPELPKLFISELQTWELPEPARAIIERTTLSHRGAFPADALAGLAALDRTPSSAQGLLPLCRDWFERLPWLAPRQEDVSELNSVSQYGAWTLVHGYNVNHFTALVNSHGVAELEGLEKTIAALKKAGVPMKAEIEGEPGSKLRQSATEAVRIPVEMVEAGSPVQVPWSYAYFELAERNAIVDAATGRTTRFEGFLGPQATNLFEMTRLT